MLILGLTKTTLLDYPGKVAATVFTGGCNFRCPFCHNGQLVLNPSREPRISVEEVLEHLDKRRNVLEGVCITGGEPTIQEDLTDFVTAIKQRGYAVKLDTNGTNPKVLEELIKSQMLDYVAMDVKNSEVEYTNTAGCQESYIAKVDASIRLLIKNMVPYEFRTTVVKPLHTKQNLEGIAEWIDGASNWYIQSFKPSEHVIADGMSAYSKEELVQLLGNIHNVDWTLRGID